MSTKKNTQSTQHDAALYHIPSERSLLRRDSGIQVGESKRGTLVQVPGLVSPIRETIQTAMAKCILIIEQFNPKLTYLENI